MEQLNVTEADASDDPSQYTESNEAEDIFQDELANVTDDDTLMEMLSEQFNSIQETEKELSVVLQQRDQYKEAVEQLDKIPVKNVKQMMIATIRVIDSISSIDTEILRLRDVTSELESQLAAMSAADEAGEDTSTIWSKDDLLIKKLEHFVHKLEIQRLAKTIFLNYVQSFNINK